MGIVIGFVVSLNVIVNDCFLICAAIKNMCCNMYGDKLFPLEGQN